MPSNLRKCAIEDCWHTATGKSKYCPYHKRIAREKWLQMIADKKTKSAPKAKPATKPTTRADDKHVKAAKYARIYQLCVESADRAANACKPTPMIVAQHANVLDDRSPIKKTWIVSGGICGIVIIKLPLNHPFSRYLVASKRAYKSEQGGVVVRRCTTNTRSPLEQSYERQCAATNAFADTLIKHLPTLRNRVKVWRHID